MASISRSITCLLTLTILFLIISSSLLFQSGEKSLVPKSIYKLILDNYSKSNETRVTVEPRSCNESCFRSKTIDTFCDQEKALLKVFMYDLPPEFHFGLLGWKGDGNRIWPNVSNPLRIPKYPNGIGSQHGMAYWLTLDLLSSTNPNVSRPCSAIRVQNSTQADVIFVPIFASWSYNRNCKIRITSTRNTDRVLQERLVKYLKGRDEWRRLGGKDHLIVAHHPHSLVVARRDLSAAMLVLADFGRYPSWIANVEKDIIAPYKHVVIRLNASRSPSFEERPILVYFQGGIYRKDGGKIRQILYHILKDENHVHFKFGKPSSDGIREASNGMASSKFCLSIAGDTPSSNRLFDAIVSHCVPVIISDDIELPFEDVLDYSKFAVFVRETDAAKKGYLVKLLKGVRREKWIEMWENLKQKAPHFEYQYPSRPSDAVDMIWQSIHRKLSSSVHNNVNRRHRYEMSRNFLNVYKTTKVFPFSKLGGSFNLN